MKEIKKRNKKKGFTLAEVLITLVVIGVVAAITIPVLISNTNGKEYNAAKQKARASIGEAFKLASIAGDFDESLTTQQYVHNVLGAKYLKFGKECDSAESCGFSEKIKTPEGTPIDRDTALAGWASITQSANNYLKEGVLANSASGYQNKNYANAGYFQTVDGFSVAVFVNPDCRGSEIDNNWYSNAATGEGQYESYGISVDSSYGAACFSAVYDMNGPKKPNQVGKDIGFVGSFYQGAGARSAAVLPVEGSTYLTNAAPSFEAASSYCRKLHGNEYDLPTIDELSLIFLNNSLVLNSNSYHFWSRSAVGGSSSVRRVGFGYGHRDWRARSYSYDRVRCVRADQLM